MHSGDQIGRSLSFPRRAFPYWSPAPGSILGFEPNSRGVLSRIAARRAAAGGLDVEPLRLEAGLPGDLETNLTAWISVRRQIHFLNLLAHAVGDDLFGFHLALDFDLRELGPFYYIMSSAPTVAEALRREERYSALVNEGIRVRCRFGKSVLVDTEYQGIERHSDKHQIEFWMVCTVRKLRELTGESIVPSLTTWVHHRGAERREIEEYLGSRVEFLAPRDRIEFAGELATMPLNTADPFLDQVLIASADEALSGSRKTPEDLRTRVENAILPRLPHGTATQSEVASELGLSGRTLSRRLQDEGLTFRELLDIIRWDLAGQYLQDPRLSLAQIAWLLGYSHAKTFARAYKAHHGMSPHEARLGLSERGPGPESPGAHEHNSA